MRHRDCRPRPQGLPGFLTLLLSDPRRFAEKSRSSAPGARAAAALRRAAKPVAGASTRGRLTGPAGAKAAAEPATAATKAVRSMVG